MLSFLYASVADTVQWRIHTYSKLLQLGLLVLQRLEGWKTYFQTPLQLRFQVLFRFYQLDASTGGLYEEVNFVRDISDWFLNGLETLDSCGKHWRRNFLFSSITSAEYYEAAGVKFLLEMSCGQFSWPSSIQTKFSSPPKDSVNYLYPLFIVTIMLHKNPNISVTSKYKHLFSS